ncbi:UDP-glycosyltransferase UGT5-like [Diorhabda sublineata]|uniref:UDP-glycosyltransferase UGT5-like n=1 Tax=Diorhabda sublineata TaxID=1163346 RepID=UPI0024E13FC3|nr:UDP-glycosyltransferase UGT5-like [Diorhabda sublineata]XP_056637220.1 UDP-glycosyltransferase UGT5-like [Diorhabda sublineata]
MKVIIWIFILLKTVCDVESYKILFVFPAPIPSHFFLGNALAKGLVDAGHDITMISPYEQNYKSKNGTYKSVVLTGIADMMMDLKVPTWVEIGRMNPFMQDSIVLNPGTAIVNFTLNHPNFRKFLRSPDEKFDVIILELFLNDAFKVLSCHFNAPLILFSTLGPNFWTNSQNGNPTPLSYIPDFFQPFSTKMTFWQRTLNTWYTLFRFFNRDYVFLPKQLQCVKKHFPQCYTDDLYYKSSLTLVNYHESVNYPVPLVPNMIPVGGLHIKPSNKLPNDLQEYLDGATEGVIYFSLGSNLLFSQLDNHIKKSIINSFKKRKEIILLTCDEDLHLSNIIAKKWFPQQDVLAHPKVKLFISHGGLLSIMEAVYNGVPVLALPVFADQKMNGATLEQYEFGLSVLFHDLNEDNLSESINRILTVPKYRENMKKRSKLFHDRPMKPLDVAIYWTEFVAKYKDTSHLKVAALDLEWYQYFLLDVIALTAVIIIGICVVIIVSIKFVLKMFLKKEKIKIN